MLKTIEGTSLADLVRKPPGTRGVVLCGTDADITRVRRTLGVNASKYGCSITTKKLAAVAADGEPRLYLEIEVVVQARAKRKPPGRKPSKRRLKRSLKQLHTSRRKKAEWEIAAALDEAAARYEIARKSGVRLSDQVIDFVQGKPLRDKELYDILTDLAKDETGRKMIFERKKVFAPKAAENKELSETGAPKGKRTKFRNPEAELDEKGEEEGEEVNEKGTEA
jgi:hypothetical protein